MAVSITPKRPCQLFLLALFGLLMQTMSHADVLVFTNHTNPVTNVGSDSVIYLDQPQHIESKLSEGLSSDPVEAEQQASRRVQDRGMQQSLVQSYLQVVKAWQLGVVKVPAVVVDGRYVVYGQPDVQKALQQIVKYQQGGEHD